MDNTHAHHHGHSDHHHHPADDVVVRDPVCGMTVDPAAGKPSFEHEGRRYLFCCEGCRTKFEAAPADYRNGKKPQPKPAPKGTQYTCPMHPEVISDHPGDCAKCGMALEPMGIPPMDEGPNPELIDFTRRLWISGILSVPLLVI